MDMSGRDARGPTMTPYLLAAPLIVFMIAFYVLPVVAMLMRSVSDPSWTLQHYAALPDDVVFLKTFANTFYTSLIVTLASLLLGYPVALALVQKGSMISTRMTGAQRGARTRASATG